MAFVLKAVMDLLRYLHNLIMFISPEPPLLSYLLDSERISRRPITDFRVDMENTFGRMEEGVEKLLLVTELVWLKQVQHVSQYEYINVAVRGPGDALYYFAFEPSGGRTATTHPLNCSAGTQSATDTVTILPTERREGEEIMIRIPCGFPLYQLVVLADTIHSVDPNYLLLDTNCFSYAGKMVETIAEGFQIVVNKEVPLEAHSDGFQQPISHILSKPGYWVGVKICSESPKPMVEKLAYDWQTGVEAFEATIKRYRLPAVQLEATRRELEARDRELEDRDRELEAKDREIEAVRREIEAARWEIEELRDREHARGPTRMEF